MVSTRVSGCLITAGLAVAVAAGVQTAAPKAAVGVRSVNDGVYTDTQARRGERHFDAHCAKCHEPARFTGQAFVTTWRGPLDVLFETLRDSMPEDNPGSLPPQDYADLIAFMLSLNGYPAGPDRLDGRPDVMQIVQLEPPANGAHSPAQIIPGPDPSRPFSAAVKADGLIYISGTIGSPSGVAGDIKQQTKDTLDNIAAILKTAGSSLANAASVTVYLRNAADFAAMNEVYAGYFPKDPPARTTVVVTQPLAAAEGLVEISMVAVPNGAERAVVHPAGWAKPAAPYSYGIKSGNTLFLAGLVSRSGKDNSNMAGDLAAQTKAAMDNGAEILKAAGMGFADVVSSRVWVSEASNQPMNDVYRTYFEGVAPPVRAAVRANLTGPDLLVEVTMIAVKDPSRKAVIPPNADGSPGRASANLSPAIQVGNRLYVAGMLGSTAANRGDAKAQTAEALVRIERALKAAGFDWSNVVDGLVYFPDMTKYEDMNAAYREVFTQRFPARATIGAGLGGDALVEIMFTAVK